MPASTDLHNLYVVLKHGDINGRLAAHDGKIIVILDNYTQVYPEKPEQPADGNTHVYAIQVRDDDLVIDRQDTGDSWRIWLGDKGSRTRPQDKASVRIAPACAPFGVEASDAPGSPKEAAIAVFDSLPEDVKLAAVVDLISTKTLVDLKDIGDVIAARLKAWSSSRLAEYAQEANRG